MSPIQSIINEVSLEKCTELLESLDFENIMDEQNMTRITTEESPNQTIVRIETKCNASMMITIPKGGTLWIK